MQKSIYIKIKGEVVLCLPASIKVLTTYVCIEQGDWFEDEIKFIRKLITPGMKIIDIGANYGIYSIQMAKLTGDNGTVWSFEPDTRLSPYIVKSIEKNNLNNIIINNMAISNYSGKTTFYLSENSEFNSISHNPQFHSEKIEVETLTIDQCMEKFCWNKIDFIKIDAEGEELKIFEAAKSFLAKESPLIMFECSHIDFKPLVDELFNFGYYTYKVIPGLNLLVPLKLELEEKPSQLNIFSCKQDRAEILEKRGLLVTQAGPEIFPVENESTLENYLWQNQMVNLPFCQNMIEKWIKNNANPTNNDRKKYLKALNYYFLSKNPDLNPLKRYSFMKMALSGLESIDNLFSNTGRLQTLVRIFSELGMRFKALDGLKKLIVMVHDIVNVSIPEPFLPVLERFDFIIPEKKIKDWCLISFFEQYEILCGYSSYFHEFLFLDQLKKLNNYDLLSDEMKRRIMLNLLKKEGQTEIDLSNPIWNKEEFKSVLTYN